MTSPCVRMTGFTTSLTALRLNRLLMPSIYKSIVGKKIRFLRLRAGMTQEILSERCGIFRTYLSRIESGVANPTLLVLIALAEALDVLPGDLFREPIL